MIVSTCPHCKDTILVFEGFRTKQGDDKQTEDRDYFYRECEQCSSIVKVAKRIIKRK